MWAGGKQYPLFVHACVRNYHVNDITSSELGCDVTSSPSISSLPSYEAGPDCNDRMEWLQTIIMFLSKPIDMKDSY